MSHFLERLAAGVMQPASRARLRPLVGSVFAPTQQMPHTGFAPTESSVLFSARETPVRTEADQAPRSALRPPEDTPTGETDTQQSLPLLQTTAQPEGLSGINATKDTEKPAIRPLISVSNPVTPFGAPLVGLDVGVNPVDNEQVRQEDRQQVRKSIPAIDPQQRLSEADAPVAYRPLIRVEEAAVGVPAPHRLPHESGAGAAKNPSAEVSSRAVSPPHEPDEIHIHIGRIEVAAIPQPVQRPAAPPARKSLDLGEYLKRSSRRSG